MKELTKPYPLYEDCCCLWRACGTPDHVIRHCQAVSRTAVLIAQELNRNGFRLNLPLLAAAGWLHDMLRLQEDHGLRAAELLKSLGYEEIAALIAVHMSYQRDPQSDAITETDLLCFADRVVREDRFVGLKLRMEYIIDKSIRLSHPEAEPRIRKSFQQAEEFQKKIEAIIGKSIREIEHITDELGKTGENR